MKKVYILFLSFILLFSIFSPPIQAADDDSNIIISDYFKFSDDSITPTDSLILSLIKSAPITEYDYYVLEFTVKPFDFFEGLTKGAIAGLSLNKPGTYSIPIVIEKGSLINPYYYALAEVNNSGSLNLTFEQDSKVGYVRPGIRLFSSSSLYTPKYNASDVSCHDSTEYDSHGNFAQLDILAALSSVIWSGSDSPDVTNYCFFDSGNIVNIYNRYDLTFANTSSDYKFTKMDFGNYNEPQPTDSKYYIPWMPETDYIRPSDENVTRFLDYTYSLPEDYNYYLLASRYYPSNKYEYVFAISNNADKVSLEYLGYYDDVWVKLYYDGQAITMPKARMIYFGNETYPNGHYYYDAATINSTGVINSSVNIFGFDLDRSGSYYTRLIPFDPKTGAYCNPYPTMFGIDTFDSTTYNNKAPFAEDDTCSTYTGPNALPGGGSYNPGPGGAPVDPESVALSNTFLEKIYNQIVILNSNIVKFKDGVSNDVKNIKNNVIGLSNIMGASGLANGSLDISLDTILDESFLLPDNYFSTQFNSMNSVIYSKFTFYNDSKTTINSMVVPFNNADSSCPDFTVRMPSNPVDMTSQPIEATYMSCETFEEVVPPFRLAISGFIILLLAFFLIKNSSEVMNK